MVKYSWNGVTYDVEERDRRLNPDTETLMFMDELEDGMRVLIEPVVRAQIKAGSISNVYDDRPLIHNRWCTVSKFRGDEATSAFIGIYDDGDMQVRQHRSMTGFFVTKESIAANEKERRNKYAHVPYSKYQPVDGKYETQVD